MAHRGRACLYIFSGLPGAGKTSLAQKLARSVGAAYLRIDTIEQGLRDLCGTQVQGEGYRLAYRIAADNLQLGVSVVADSCNPIELTRNEWMVVATDCAVDYRNIEVHCSDAIEHRRRIETRTSTVVGLKLPTWQEVVDREFDVWTTQPIRIDTAGRTESESFVELSASINIPAEAQESGMPPLADRLPDPHQ